GLVDCTYKYICRPSRFQETCWNRYKKKHGIKFLTIIGPDGIIYHCFGATEGRRHDGTLYREARLPYLMMRDCRGFYLIGDVAFPLSPFLLKPLLRSRWNPLTAAQKYFNKRLASLRVVVEWGYQLVNSLWAYQNFYTTQQVFKTKPSQYYLACTLLTNCYNCIYYPNRVSTYFGLDPPTLEEYMSY
ncbi:unnamed protein product, partial [Heterosigma akashiwo]